MVLMKTNNLGSERGEGVRPCVVTTKYSQFQPKPARGSGECCKLSQRPQTPTTLVPFRLKKKHLVLYYTIYDTIYMIVWYMIYDIWYIYDIYTIYDIYIYDIWYYMILYSPLRMYVTSATSTTIWIAVFLTILIFSVRVFLDRSQPKPARRSMENCKLS